MTSFPSCPKKCYHVNIFSPSENRWFSQHRPQEMMPKNATCERIFPSWKSTISSTSPPRGDAEKIGTMWTYFPSFKIANFLNIAPKWWCRKKCYHVNVFSPLENCQFLRHRPQEVMHYLIYFSYVLLQRMARAARTFFQYMTNISYGFLKK